MFLRMDRHAKNHLCTVWSYALSGSCVVCSCRHARTLSARMSGYLLLLWVLGGRVGSFL